jgi:hypothetical protein
MRISSLKFINSLRLFYEIQWKQVCPTGGTYFVGALNDINIKRICVENGLVMKHLQESCILWKFNAPHVSHLKGV